MYDLAIETNGLTKTFKNNTAVSELNLAVQKGSIFGFLGPNGAGKTTTIKMLLGLHYPTAGSGKVLGYDMVTDSLAIRKKTGFIAETQNMYSYMKVKEIISFVRGAYQTWDDNIVNKYLNLFELPPNRKVKELSKGMRTQLGLTLALGPKPELLIFDEPTSGLDPIKQKEFLSAIVEQVAVTGQTVFFSSHHLWEVERIADTVGIINQGKLILCRNIDELKANQKKIRVVLEQSLPAEISKMPGIAEVQKQGNGYIISVHENADEVISAVEKLSPITIDIINQSLEDIFMEYVGRDHNE